MSDQPDSSDGADFVLWQSELPSGNLMRKRVERRKKWSERLISHLNALVCVDCPSPLPQTFLWCEFYQRYKAQRGERSELISGFTAADIKSDADWDSLQTCFVVFNARSFFKNWYDEFKFNFACFKLPGNNELHRNREVHKREMPLILIISENCMFSAHETPHSARLRVYSHASGCI